MTKKDYIIIARIVAVASRGAGLSRYEKRGAWITEQLKTDNKNFDAGKFWGAVENAKKGII